MTESEDRFLRELASAPAEAPDTARVGTSVAHFDVLAKIGRGGMGVVYRAHDKKLDRSVALKVLRRVEGQDDEPQKRLLREARSAARLLHPAAAAVFEVGEADDTAYIAMELVEGRTLRDRIDESPLPLEDAIRIAAEIASALAEAHRLGIVHRDIKPDNVMLTPAGAVKVLDFGLAKLEGTSDELPSPAVHPELGSGDSLLTQAGRVMGTPGYMSPEQRAADAVDGRTDIFALGVVLREMLTGSREGDVPRSVAPIVARCTAEDPNDRYDDAAALGAALDTARPQARRWPFAAAALVVAGAAVAALWPQPPLASEASVLACPPLEARGVDAPTTWLGAAAADLACRRADFYLGARETRTLTPAQLLDVPARPSKDVPTDLFSADGAKARALEAAKKRGTVWLDGSVDATLAGFTVNLALRRGASEPFATATGKGDLLFRAVGRAVDRLVDEGAIVERPLDADVARWRSTSDPRVLVAIEDLAWSVMTNMGEAVAEECDVWDAVRSRHRRPEVFDLWCVEARGTEPKPVALDESSPEALVATVVAASRTEPPEGFDRTQMLARLRKMRHEKKSAAARRAIAVAAMELAVLPRHEDLKIMSVEMAQAYPRWAFAFERVAGTHLRKPAFPHALRAFQAWTPASPDAWNMSSFGEPKTTDEYRIRMSMRAVVLAPDAPLFAANAVSPLLRAGRSEDLQSLAARVRARGPHLAFDAETLQAAFDASQGRFDASLDRMMRALRERESIAHLSSADGMAVWLALQVASIVGRSEAVAAELAERFVLADPPRLNRSDMYSSYSATLICMHAADEVLRPCARRVRELSAEGYFLLGHSSSIGPYMEGLAAYADGDVDGLVRHWRPLTPEIRGRSRRAKLLTKVGRDDLAAVLERLEPTSMALTFNGARFIDVQRAKRLAKDGRNEEARALARTIVDAWTSADTDVPLLSELRDL